MTVLSEIEPVPVTLSDRDKEFIRAKAEFTPVFGSWQTFIFAGVAAETKPQVFMPADLKRRRATFYVSGAGAGYVLVGALGQVSNGQGGRIYSGQRWKLENHSLLYIAGDGASALNVALLIERDQD